MRRSGALVLLALALSPALAAAQEQDTLRNTLGPLPEFTLTDQNGNVIRREHLLGKVCVISFFFTCCADVCPVTQSSMAELQEKFAKSPDVLLVSINVYPSHDTPDILQSYARDKTADPGRWLFLRADSEAQIQEVVEKGFHLALARNPKQEKGREVLHSQSLLVVDHRGVIRGYVDGKDKEEVKRLEGYVGRLVQAKYFPTVNAGLNALCGVLLVAGFFLIKARWVLAHKVCMVGALAVSAVFLGCYLYYHFLVLDGQPTRFTGEGAARAIYLVILLSHTLLAAAVAPLALRVTYLGLRNRLARHTALARWTLPVWLYVSITGVVVYWMLYHLYPAV